MFTCKLVFLYGVKMTYDWVDSGKWERQFTSFMYLTIQEKNVIKTEVEKYAPSLLFQIGLKPAYYFLISYLREN